MFYRAIGLMSGSSLDGLDIVFAEFEESRGKWTLDIRATACVPYSTEWQQRLATAHTLATPEYLRLHSAYGQFLGEAVNEFIDTNNLHHQVQLIASHGHTVFHDPAHRMTAQLGDGAAIAAATGINVVSDLRAMDIALGGQGAPIVPLGEKLLFADYPLLLNLGGIANISAATADGYIAYDVCPANRVLNLLAADAGLEYDAEGQLAAKGFVRDEVLSKLNQQAYYSQSYPKSLANDFGVNTLYPLLKQASLSAADALRTMTEHICIQVTRNAGRLAAKLRAESAKQLLVTGGGAFNSFLVERLRSSLRPMGIEVVIPEAQTIQYKEAVIMGLLGVLRWREENTVMDSVTGASRSSIGGAVWIGQTA